MIWIGNEMVGLAGGIVIAVAIGTTSLAWGLSVGGLVLVIFSMREFIREMIKKMVD